MKGLIALAVLRLALKLDLGPEYDTNANRAEVIDGTTNPDHPTASALLRTTTRLQLSWRRGISLLNVYGGLGAKAFFNPAVADQNVLVGQLGVDERVTIGRFVDFGVAGDYYDAGQLNVTPPCAAQGCNRRRDFRTGSAAARLTFVDDPGDVTLLAGWRGFQYKPDSSYDFEAVQASLVAAARAHSGHGEHAHEWALTAAYHIERRWFSGLADVNDCSPLMPCPLPGRGPRLDWYHEAGLELSYLGPLLVTTGYGVQLNESNSFGFSLLRHVLTVRLAARLPWQLYATVKAQLLFASYFDKLVLDLTNPTCICIEDENRNALIVDVERPIGKTGVALEARYSYYTNELGTESVHFTRHVVYLGVSYKAGWRFDR